MARTLCAACVFVAALLVPRGSCGQMPGDADAFLDAMKTMLEK